MHTDTCECNHMHHNAYLDAVRGQLRVHPRLGPMDKEEARAVRQSLCPDEGPLRILLSLKEAQSFFDNLGVDHGGLEAEGVRHVDGIILKEKR